MFWLLTPKEKLIENNPWDPWYDKAFGFIVSAETEEEARGFANKQAGDENRPGLSLVSRDVWLNSELTNCVDLETVNKVHGVVIRDFAAA